MIRSLPLVLLVACGVPVAAPLAITPSDPTTSDDLRAALASPPADGVRYAWRWELDGVEVPGAIGDAIGAGLTRKGQRWSAIATPIRDGVEGDPVRAEVTIANTAPTVAVVLTPKDPRGSDDLVAVVAHADADGDPRTVRDTWQRNGADVPDLDGPTVPRERVAKGERWAVRAVASDGESDSEAATAELTIQNSAPVVTSIRLSPSEPYTNNAVSVVAEGFDPDGDALTFKYRWSVGGSVLASQTGTTLGSALFRRDQVVEVTVTANDGTVDSAPVASTPLPIRNSAPTYGSVDLTPATARAATVLSCAPRDGADLDGDPITPQFAWRVNGVDVPVAGPTYGPGLVRRGDTVQCLATPFDGTNAGSAVLSRVITILNTAPTAPTVGIDPVDPTTADPILCDVTVPGTDADADTLSYGFRWFRNGVEWTGTTAATLYDGDTIPESELRADDVWRCEGRSSDGLATSDWSASSADVTVKLGQITYPIKLSQLVNLTQDCSSGLNIKYTCSGRYGFTWDDTAGRAPRWVQIDFFQGINCTGGNDRPAWLNDASIGSSPFADRSACDCNAVGTK
jgi:hypothetical protein